MRATKRVLIGSLAAASDSASRAVCTATPSISKITRPGFTRATHNSGAPLPEPMRTSSGFFDTGTSGNTRIQTRPARFMLRVSAPRGFDLPRRDPLRLHRLQPELAECQRRGAGRDPVDAAFVGLAEFRSHR